MLLLKIAILWLAVDIITLATAWYILRTLKPRVSSRWWRRVVADNAPKFEKL